MKKILYTLIAGAMALASCSNNDDAIGIDPSNATTVFTLGVDDAITRATTTIAPARYVMEVWSEDGTTAENVFEDGTKNRAEITTGNSFTVVLDQTKAYTCLFWADDNTAYDATTLKAIALKAEQEVTEAYHAKATVPTGKNPAITVSLKRAVAKVTLTETGTLEAGKNLTATYAQLPQFSVLDGQAMGTPEDNAYTATLAADALTGQVAQFYLLATTEQSLTDFSFVYSDEAPKTVSNVPVQQNYVTNIKGSYSSLGSFTFEIKADDAWGTPDNEVEPELPPFTVRNTTKGKLKEAIAAAKLTTSPKIIILGPVNDADMKYAASLTTLTELDLSKATLWGKADKYFAETENTLTYEAFNNNTTLSTVTLPASLDRIEKNAFYFCKALTSITIPESVTSIEEWAFYQCSKLETVTFESTSKLKKIGRFAFNYCSALTSIAIPASVTSIEWQAFVGCSKLETVTFEGTSKLEKIGGGVFERCSTLTSIAIPASVTSIEDKTFYQCSKLETVTFTGTPQLEKIGSFAFHSCTALTSIAIPASVTSIEGKAFYQCTKLETVTFEGTPQLETIGVNVFEKCTALTSIAIPASVTSIEDEAFVGCTKLGTVTFESTSKLKKIGRYAFKECSALTSIAIPASVTSIEGQAFVGTQLATVTFEGTSNLETISGSAFEHCTTLTSIAIPASVTSIGKAAFRYCTKLATVTFESTSKLKTIEASVFWNCTILTSIAIPASVTSIGDFAFGGCGLESITLHCTTMIPFADGLFQNHSPQSIYVPAGLVAAYKNANGWKGYADKIQAIPS